MTTEKEVLFDKLRATTFSTTENLVSIFIIVVTLFTHLVFTMVFHLMG